MIRMKVMSSIVRYLVYLGWKGLVGGGMWVGGKEVV